MPWFWIVAGPNGAGKSTLVESGAMQSALGTDLISLNADVRTGQLLDAEPCLPDANLRAAIEIDAQVAACIEQRINFLVETVLSSDKYLDDIERALSLGYQLGVIYVGVATPEDSILRVALRRTRGGHDVPKERIVARWHRSIAMLARIAPSAHRLYVFDNSSVKGPVLIACNEGSGLVWHAPGRIPEIDSALVGNGLQP